MQAYKVGGRTENMHPDVPKPLIKRSGKRSGRMQLIFADGEYAGKFVDRVRGSHGRFVEIVKRSASSGFVVLPKRWIAERTFAWLG